MLNREDWLMIKQMHNKGCYQRDIAEQVGVSERTVRRALARSGPPARRKAKRRPSKLDPYLTEIDRLLADNVWNAQVILAELRVQGYTGGHSILRDHIRPKRKLRQGPGTVRFETPPGKQLQRDWGEIIVEIGGSPRKIYFAVNLLGYSRRFHVFAAPRNDAEHTYESLIRSFEYFDGVPNEVWGDNQKAAIIEHTAVRLQFNPGFVLLAEHYGFVPKACRPARPQTKGKDERMVGYVKRNFFVRYRRFTSFAHLNQLLEHWLAEVADPRVHSTVKEVVIERFARERPQLKAIAPVRFDTSYRAMRRAALDGLIDVDGNRYSVPARTIGEPVTVAIGLDGTLKVFDAQDRLIAQHHLRDAKAGWQVVPEHHARLWQAACAVERRGLDVYAEAASCN